MPSLRDGSLGYVGRLATYQSILPLFGILISKKLATLYELQTLYSLNDAYILYDILEVDSYNARLVNELIEDKKQQNAQQFS